MEGTDDDKLQSSIVSVSTGCDIEDGELVWDTTKLALGNPPGEAQSRATTMDHNKRTANTGKTEQEYAKLAGVVR